MLLEVKDVTTYTRYMVYYLVRMLMNGAENYTNIILSTIMKLCSSLKSVLYSKYFHKSWRFMQIILVNIAQDQ